MQAPVNEIAYEQMGIIIQGVVAVGFVAMVMWVTHLLGPKHGGKKKLENFECGYEAKGDARMPFSVKYFVTAILFVLFDVEVIFFYPWAVNFKELLADGFLKMVLFVVPLLLGFYYVIRKGALKWD